MVVGGYGLLWVVVDGGEWWWVMAYFSLTMVRKEIKI